MVVEPEKAFIMGGSYRIPVLLGLQPRTFVEDLKRDSTFNEASFGREYEKLYSINFMNCWNFCRLSKKSAAKTFKEMFNDYSFWKQEKSEA